MSERKRERDREDVQEREREGKITSFTFTTDMILTWHPPTHTHTILFILTCKFKDESFNLEI